MGHSVERDAAGDWIAAELADAARRWNEQDDATKTYVNADYWSNPSRPTPPGSGATPTEEGDR